MIGGAASFRMPRAELERRLGAGERYAEIAAECGVERWTVRRRANGFGLETPRRATPAAGVLPGADGLRLLLSNTGIPLAAIARTYGVSVDKLKSSARAHGLPFDVAGRAALGRGR